MALHRPRIPRCRRAAAWLPLVAVLLGSRTAAAQSWCAHAPRAVDTAFTRVATSDPWFQVHRVEPGVFALYEPGTFQEVISWLVVGERRALLFDSGMGISRIRAVVAALTSLPVTVLNSHSHIDHVGGNAEFSTILAMDLDYSRQRARGVAHEWVAEEVAPAAFCPSALRVPFDTATYRIRPFVSSGTVADGDILDLGGRRLEVLHVPGHAPDALALLDRDRGLLFTGDSFYEGPIWLFSEGTDLAAYGRSVARLAALAPALRRVLPGHNTLSAAPHRLVALRDAFARVTGGAVAPASRAGVRYTYEVDGFTFIVTAEQAPLRVLFIGNSYTYFQNLPDVLASLASSAAPPRQVHVAMEAAGGASLRDHWMRGKALARIEEGGWDAVVLQEQSTLGRTLLDGRPAINAPDALHRYVRLFDRAIRRAGARTILYNTWSRRGAPPAHQAALDAAYTSIGAAIGARVAPVGVAWQALQGKPGIPDLYAADGSHPSPAGTYLAASVLWGTITGTLPEGLAPIARGRPILDLGTGAGMADTTAPLVALAPGIARQLQAAAASALRQAQLAPSSAAHEPPPPARDTTPPPSGTTRPPALVPALPAGEPLSADILVGRWEGTMRLYDAPATVTPQVVRRGDRLVGRWVETYANDAGSTARTLDLLRVESHALHFTVSDPRFLAPPIVHRAVWRDGTLEGVAEVGSGEQLPHLIGRWSLRRR